MSSRSRIEFIFHVQMVMGMVISAIMSRHDTPDNPNTPEPSLWQNRNFRLVFSATSASNLGDGVAMVAYPWLASMISRDPLDIAFVAFASRLPWFLMSLPAGVITDRVSHKRLMVGADIFRFILTLAVVALVLLGPVLPSIEPARGYILALAALAFFLGSAEVLRDNTAQTILPRLVRVKDLPRANGTMWSAEQIIGEFVGPPLAGFLIALALPLPFALDALTFALAAVLVSRLKPKPAHAAPHKPAFAAMKEGLGWLVRHALLLRLALITGFMNFAGTVSLTILVLFAQDILHVGPLGYGLIMSFGAVGGGLGGLLAPRIVTRIGQGWGLRIAVVLVGVETVIIGAANHPAWVGFALFLATFGSLLWNVVAVPIRQKVVPPELLGRVNSVYRFISWGVIPLGALLAGFLVKGINRYTEYETALRAPYFILGFSFVLVSIYVFKTISNQSVST